MIKLKRINFILLTIVFTFLVYFYFLSKNKSSIQIKNNFQQTNISELSKNPNITKFTNVEYKTFDKSGKEYIIRGDIAFLDAKKPNIIKLEGVYSFTKLKKNNSILKITSRKAIFFKDLNDIEYYENVVIDNLDRKITCNSAKYESKKNIIELNTNVVVTDTLSKIKSDKARINTITNDIEMYMVLDDSKVYGERKKK